MKLAYLSTDALRARLQNGRLVALLPVGSVEPHGPHLPLATDACISEVVAERAADRLSEQGVDALLAPTIPYGVTEYARGFAGAVSVPPDVLTPFVRSVIEALVADGFAHVCVVNNHLEPDQDAALRSAIVGLDGRASLASPLARRWGRTLSDEYRSGACHAGRYETSLVLAAAPELVDVPAARALPSLPTSLSQGIAAGQRTFAEMGLDRAYTGAPAEASRAEGLDLIERLATMVVTEVLEALTGSSRSTPA